MPEIWHNLAHYMVENFENFVEIMSKIGILEWREKERRYKCADIYVYGFEMERRGTLGKFLK
ncbi:MAG: hypothetical protein WCD53_00685 [Microcoleus sp.]